MKLSKGQRVTLLVVLLLVIDQIIKFAVKLNMSLGEDIPVLGDWFHIYFIENNGMAFGMQLGGEWGKLALSLFRLILIGFIIYYIVKLLKKQAIIEMAEEDGELSKDATEEEKNAWFEKVIEERGYSCRRADGSVSDFGRSYREYSGQPFLRHSIQRLIL